MIVVSMYIYADPMRGFAEIALSSQQERMYTAMPTYLLAIEA